jgi:hypothetical protein
MICALLLLRATGASWIPFLAIPGVLAGLSFSILLTLSGLAGLFSTRLRSIANASRMRSPVRVTISPFVSALRR